MQEIVPLRLATHTLVRHRRQAQSHFWKSGERTDLGYLGTWALCYPSFMDAFPRMRVFLMTSKYRDEVQVPCDPKTMEPLPAHE